MSEEMNEAEQIAMEVEADKENVSNENENDNNKRNTSEIFNIAIRNLGSFTHWASWTFSEIELTKLLQKLSLVFCKLKVPPCKEVVYLSFRTKEEQLSALSLLDGYKWKGNFLRVTTAKASEDPLAKRRRMNKGIETPERSILEVTCPLFNLSYEEQLEQKSEFVNTSLKLFLQDLVGVNKHLTEGIDKFEYLGICASPQITGYRNKNEFAVGRNSQGETTVGFRIGSYADGSVEVSSEIDNLPQLSVAAKWAVKTFRDFLAKTRFEPFNPDGKTGHIRQFTVRTSEYKKTIMLIVGIFSSNLSKVELKELKNEIKEHYTKIGASETNECDFKVASLYYQDLKNRESGQKVSPVEHLAFDKYITENIRDLEFRISPLAFFQVNNKGTDIVYQKIIEFAGLDMQTSVLDICCGSGTIGLSLANFCKRVIGVDDNVDAIEDAQFNAEQNNITNCKFVAANAEYFIRHMCSWNRSLLGIREDTNIVAIIDGPRAGLHNRCISAVRKKSFINRVVYISCSPKQAERNWIDLCRSTSKNYQGLPFVPVKAVTVDMFLHTNHVELVILFEREKRKDGNNLQHSVKVKSDKSVLDEDKSVLDQNTV